MAAHIGAVFEKELTKVFKLLAAERLVACHRLTDTKAAGSMVAAQPSDYIIGLPPGSRTQDGQRLFFLEAKASEKHGGLKKAMVKPSQRGAIGSYRLLLNIPYYILFWDSTAGALELWDGIAAIRETNLSTEDRLAVWQEVGVISTLRTEAVAAYLVDYFHIPLASDTLRKAR